VFVSSLSLPLSVILRLLSLFKDISGVPGTGKTATVHAIVRELKRMAEESVRASHFHHETRLTLTSLRSQETNPFTYVEINGLKIPDPTAAYSLLWEAVSGHDVLNDGHLKISSKESLKCLSRHFSAGGAAGGGAAGRGRGARGRGGPGGHA
jgi:origin recognition complex subunit 1